MNIKYFKMYSKTFIYNNFNIHKNNFDNIFICKFKA